MEKLRAWINEKHGRQAELAAACGITHSAVWQWKQVPPNHLVTVEATTGIPREELRPELFREAVQ